LRSAKNNYANWTMARHAAVGLTIRFCLKIFFLPMHGLGAGTLFGLYASQKNLLHPLDKSEQKF